MENATGVCCRDFAIDFAILVPGAATARPDGALEVFLGVNVPFSDYIGFYYYGSGSC